MPFIAGNRTSVTVARIRGIERLATASCRSQLRAAAVSAGALSRPGGVGASTPNAAGLVTR